MAFGEFFRPIQEDIQNEVTSKIAESVKSFRDAADLVEQGGDLQALNQLIEQGQARIAGLRAGQERIQAIAELVADIRRRWSELGLDEPDLDYFRRFELLVFKRAAEDVFGAGPEPTPGVRDLTDIQDRTARTLLMIDKGERPEEDRFTHPTLKDVMMHLRPFEPDELVSEEVKKRAENKRYGSIRTARTATLEMLCPALDNPEAAPPKVSELLNWARVHHPIYERASLTDYDEAMRRVVSVQDLRRRFTNSV